MRAFVQPTRKYYRILFFDNHSLRLCAIVELEDTPGGIRPTRYRVKMGSASGYKNMPSRDLLVHLRRSQVKLTSDDGRFASFLKDLQIPYSYAGLCRICLMDDHITELDDSNSVKFGEGEFICMSCAKKEIRRELVHMGKIGRAAITHLDELLLKYRDVDRVLSTIDPDKSSIGSTLFDRLEAHPVLNTAHICELPLPGPFVDASGVERLMPVQQLSVEAGLLFGKDLLVVAATASGKTFIGELAGMKNLLEKRGRMIFMVPLVALAFQKYERFLKKYGNLTDVSIITGKSRIHLQEKRRKVNKNKNAGIVIATYEGIDHLMRVGDKIDGIGTVVIDEVQMLEDSERGHRLDGLISRLKFMAPKAQYLYLSATIGHPKLLAKKLSCNLVQYSDRPVSLERYLIFLERQQKVPTEKKLVAEEYKNISSKGYHGQSIVFTNSRIRCHVIADKLGEGVSPYHAGLTQEERRIVEEKFEKGQLRGVVTTAALAAGVDFPASQVIFDSLAMGIEWLTVQEFSQMSGRAGRPDYHDLGKVVILAEPGGSYCRGSNQTEEEIAMGLLKGEMGEVAPVYGIEESSELYVANAVVCGGDREKIAGIEETLVGENEPVEDLLFERSLIYRKQGKIVLTPLAEIMAEHFIGVERLTRIIELVQQMKDPLDIIADLDCLTDEEAALQLGRKISNVGSAGRRLPQKKSRKGRRKKK